MFQISGKTDVAKRALYEVSTLLHQNPRKDKYPNVPMPYGGHNLHPPGPMTSTLSPGNRMWAHRDSASHSMPPMPWVGGYGNQPSGYGPGGFNGVPPGHGGEPQAEFSMKILCSTGKIGGVIGKGGSNIRVVEQETGASIKVEDISAESNERAIRVSAFEILWNPRSQTIEAILQLQNKTSEFSEKGAIITRLLVPSSKVGCILGQGGQVINEMRRRTQADIRVYSKDEKPKCALEDEELVQISGNFGVAKDALAEIASRLRVRTLRDANVGAESGHVGSVRGFGPARPGRGPLPSSMIGGSISNRCEPLMGGGHEYEPQSYPVPASATGYSNASNLWEGNISNNGVKYVMGAGGSNISNIGESVSTRVKLRDSQPGGSESAVAIHGTSENLTAPQGFLQAWSSAGQNMNVPQVSHQNNLADKPSSYQNMSAQHSTYQNINVQQSPYQNVNLQQSPFQNLNSQQSPYSVAAQQVAYTNASDPHGPYHNISAQGAYQF
uniref:Poly RC-binding protein n=1 Tax=Rhizophora mucronata TaxID=61149 RepID=A0A2P2K3I0_RHIMU